MTWRMRVRHRTGYSYDGEVRSSYNEARMTPLTDPTQTTLESRVEISPNASTYRYRDYWGTEVTAFDLHSPHTELEVVATSVVETGLRDWAPGGLDWEVLRSDPVIDQYSEWLDVTPPTDPDGTLTGLARDIAGRGGTPTETAQACLDAIGDRLDVCARFDRRQDLGGPGLGGGQRGLPRFRPHLLGHVAIDRAAGPLRLGIPASGLLGRDRPDRERREPRLGRMVGR